MKIHASVGDFAGDKEAAAHIRETYLRRCLSKNEPAILDFVDVGLATQSFIHALVAAVVRENPDNLDLIEFKNCNSEIRAVIGIVVEYAQEDFE